MRLTQRIGRYHLTKRIGFGGMAEIFRGLTYDNEGVRRDVAIKKLLPHFLEDDQFIDMLTNEFKLVSQLRHPNIAEVYELAEVDNSVLISMEYVDGKDLRSTMDRAKREKSPLAWDHVVYVIARALDGLHHAHIAKDSHEKALEIVHRDFSPSNILVAYDGRVKICDFGIAKARLDRVQTKTGIIKGKVKYMSPEQAFGHPLDHRSDIFSAGSVLYELCTGQPPFQADNEIDLIFSVRDAEPKPAQVVCPDLPAELATIIARSMARDREQRYATAAEFRDALMAFLAQYKTDYSRSHLARLMKQLWRQQIEDELRKLEDFVLDVSNSEDFGKNLIADVLGADAPYARFSPYHGNLAATSEPHARPYDRMTELHDMFEDETTVDSSEWMNSTPPPAAPLEGEQTARIVNIQRKKDKA